MKKISILATLVFLTSCQENLVRSDLINSSAGNAQSANTALQNVDPWQRYVYDTDLETSSLRQAKARAKYNGVEDEKSTTPTVDPLLMLMQGQMNAMAASPSAAPL